MVAKNLKVAVVGAGAIGGVTAAFMKKAGWDPVLVCKHADTLAQVKAPGLQITGLKGTHTVPLSAVQTITELPTGLDIVFHATKANDGVAAAEALLPKLKPDSVVVSLQNGISEDALAEVLGRERVTGCVVGWGATHTGCGKLEVTSDGEFIVGNIDHQPDGRLEMIRPMLAAVQPTRISDNIMGELYSKLMINACINSLGAITGVTLGELLAVRKIRSIFIALMQEALAVATAMGIRVAPSTGGKLDYYRFLAGSGVLKQVKRHLVIRMIGLKYRRIRSSSLQSLERGRPTEIDYLNGYICDRADDHGVPVPVNRAVVAMIKAIEAKQRPLSMENMADPVFAEF
ncbi:MAG: 2-dehydropantoate 2-reductase [Desulfobacteraceae bacterium]|nr:2-dehydropantoate 2-reductase [Desulfobacteraceae bacterium]MBC2749319.1 2-dehydropantoate 2-reductase [Desulfobacteraceae bacterium]